MTPVHLFVFDTLADWEPGYAVAGINNPRFQEAGDTPLVGECRFSLGLGFLSRSEIDAAEREFAVALPIAEKSGDVTLLSRCLTYAVVLHRRRGDLDRARRAAERALAFTTRHKLLEYMAMARANFSWLALRGGDLRLARREAEAAVDLWSQSSFIYPFKWTALWPLIAVSLADGNLSDVVEHARALSHPSQQPLPPRLSRHVDRALTSWEAGSHEAARAELDAAAKIAGEFRYL